jgi:hypothetical protein
MNAWSLVAVAEAHTKDCRRREKSRTRSPMVLGIGRRPVRSLTEQTQAASDVDGVLFKVLLKVR